MHTALRFRNRIHVDDSFPATGEAVIDQLDFTKLINQVTEEFHHSIVLSMSACSGPGCARIIMFDDTSTAMIGVSNKSVYMSFHNDPSTIAGTHQDIAAQDKNIYAAFAKVLARIAEELGGSDWKKAMGVTLQ